MTALWCCVHFGKHYELFM